MKTSFSHHRILGLLVGLVCATTIGQTASAIYLPQPPKPPQFEVVCYYSFHLIDSAPFFPYAEVVFATSMGETQCSNINATREIRWGLSPK